MLPEEMVAVSSIKQSRKEKRKALKKLKRKQARTDAAIREREAEESRLNDPEEQLRLRLLEQAEAEKAERERKEFEERERLWLEAAAARKSREEEDDRKKKLLEDEDRMALTENACGLDADDEYESVDEGLAEIIWQGNEIIIKKKRVKVPKGITERIQDKEVQNIALIYFALFFWVWINCLIILKKITCLPLNSYVITYLTPKFQFLHRCHLTRACSENLVEPLQDDDRPTSNPLPPQSAAFASYVQGETAQEMIDSVAQQIPNFGTEQDKAHCPFHLKTGACRFGTRCSRVHFYPDKSCTLLIKNMYNGPGLTCEQDEGLEYTDEEIERSYEEFYEDVHTEFLKFGEIINFKVCKNSSYHLRGNLYVHYKFLESAILAFNTMNARYYAGKQIICDFVGVTRWKVAICGEYMKSRLKTCSHGSACNFIHCFRNPGGDYEWADWDNPPPRYWIKRMIFLFGTSAESGYDKELESQDHRRHTEPKRVWKSNNDRHQSERFHNKEINLSNSSSDGELNSKLRYTKHSIKAEHSAKRRGHLVSEDKNEQPSERYRSEDRFYSKNYCSHSDEAVESTSKEMNHDSCKNHRRYAVNIPPKRAGRHERRSSSSRRKRKVYSEEQENSESKPRKKLYRTNSNDQGSGNGDFNEKCSPEDHDEDEDYDVARYRYRSRSDNRRKYDEHSSRRRRSHQLPEHRRMEESNESPGRWNASDHDFLVEET